MDEHVKTVGEWFQGVQSAAQNALPLNIVETEADLPQDVRKQHQGDGPIKAVFTPEAVYMVAGNIADAEAAVRAWRHEQGLHLGIRGRFGVLSGNEQAVAGAQQLDAFLDAVFERFGADSFAQYREAYGLDFANAEHRRIAAEGRLARIAGKRGTVYLIMAD